MIPLEARKQRPERSRLCQNISSVSAAVDCTLSSGHAAAGGVSARGVHGAPRHPGLECRLAMMDMTDGDIIFHFGE